MNKDTASNSGTEKPAEESTGQAAAANGASGNAGTPGSSGASAAQNQGSVSQAAQAATYSANVPKDEKSQQ